MAQFRNPLVWLYSLIATAIGAVAGAVPAVIIDPEKFNLTTGWRNLAALSAVTGLLAVANYLKQHPLPDLVPDPQAPAGGPTPERKDPTV